MVDGNGVIDGIGLNAIHKGSNWSIRVLELNLFLTPIYIIVCCYLKAFPLQFSPHVLLYLHRIH